MADEDKNSSDASLPEYLEQSNFNFSHYDPNAAVTDPKTGEPSPMTEMAYAGIPGIDTYDLPVREPGYLLVVEPSDGNGFHAKIVTHVAAQVYESMTGHPPQENIIHLDDSVYSGMSPDNKNESDVQNTPRDTAYHNKQLSPDPVYAMDRPQVSVINASTAAFHSGFGYDGYVRDATEKRAQMINDKFFVTSGGNAGASALINQSDVQQNYIGIDHLAGPLRLRVAAYHDWLGVTPYSVDSSADIAAPVQKTALFLELDENGEPKLGPQEGTSFAAPYMSGAMLAYDWAFGPGNSDDPEQAFLSRQHILAAVLASGRITNNYHSLPTEDGGIIHEKENAWGPEQNMDEWTIEELINRSGDLTYQYNEAGYMVEVYGETPAFGLFDEKAMIDANHLMVKMVDYLQEHPEAATDPVRLVYEPELINQASNEGFYLYEIDIPDDVLIINMTVEFEGTDQFSGIQSPDGTLSIMHAARKPTSGDNRFDPESADAIFSTHQFIGEGAKGKWVFDSSQPIENMRITVDGVGAGDMIGFIDDIKARPLPESLEHAKTIGELRGELPQEDLSASTASSNIASEHKPPALGMNSP